MSSIFTELQKATALGDVGILQQLVREAEDEVMDSRGAAILATAKKTLVANLTIATPLLKPLRSAATKRDPKRIAYAIEGIAVQTAEVQRLVASDVRRAATILQRAYAASIAADQFLEHPTAHGARQLLHAHGKYLNDSSRRELDAYLLTVVETPPPPADDAELEILQQQHFVEQATKSSVSARAVKKERQRRASIDALLTMESEWRQRLWSVETEGRQAISRAKWESAAAVSTTFNALATESALIPDLVGAPSPVRRSSDLDAFGSTRRYVEDNTLQLEGFVDSYARDPIYDESPESDGVRRSSSSSVSRQRLYDNRSIESIQQSRSVSFARGLSTSSQRHQSPAPRGGSRATGSHPSRWGPIDSSDDESREEHRQLMASTAARRSLRVSHRAHIPLSPRSSGLVQEEEARERMLLVLHFETESRMVEKVKVRLARIAEAITAEQTDLILEEAAGRSQLALHAMESLRRASRPMRELHKSASGLSALIFAESTLRSSLEGAEARGRADVTAAASTNRDVIVWTSKTIQHGVPPSSTTMELDATSFEIVNVDPGLSMADAMSPAPTTPLPSAMSARMAVRDRLASTSPTPLTSFEELLRMTSPSAAAAATTSTSQHRDPLASPPVNRRLNVPTAAQRVLELADLEFAAREIIREEERLRRRKLVPTSLHNWSTVSGDESAASSPGPTALERLLMAEPS